MVKIFVLAKDYQNYQNFLRETNLSDRCVNLEYLSSPTQMTGLNKFSYVCYKDYYNHEEFTNIWLDIVAYEALGRVV